MVYNYTYKDHKIIIDLSLNLSASRKSWQAEVIVFDPPDHTTSRKISFRRAFDTTDQAVTHGRAFVEKWIDDGKPSIRPDELG